MKPLLIILSLVLLGGVAHADEDCQPDPNYDSPLRATWGCEVQKDPDLKADIEDGLREAVHRQESASFTRNNQHVVMAYIAIWVLTAGFILLIFLRQQKLKGDIAFLQAELARAMKDDGK
jgi:hypothetical protein